MIYDELPILKGLKGKTIRGVWRSSDNTSIEISTDNEIYVYSAYGAQLNGKMFLGCEHNLKKIYGT